ncbi:MAG: flagellar filament outer layer protein FlaA [Treponema sp.]|jgi:hypothetical protein|nr:flagellar filament outer layer protein FlaA [Treponema sp.]
MRKFLIIALFLFIAGFAFAQNQGQNEIGTPDAEQLGTDSAQRKIKEVSVDKFEHDGFWRSRMSSDEGYVTSRLFGGDLDNPAGPKGKKPIEEEADLGISDNYVMGTRVDFLRRGHNNFFIYPTRPIPIEGIAKYLTVWVAGRNFKHDLFLQIQDFFGKNYELYVGKMNFMGWKQMTVVVPESIVQRNYHYNNHMGIKVMGFRIECDPLESFGSYYLYFDDLRAVTDLFAEEERDEDDMADGW